MLEAELRLRFVDAGESHGRMLVGIIEGIPAGLNVDESFINRDLMLRQSGYGRGGRQNIEKDRVVFLSGLRRGETIGSPIAISVENRDFENWKSVMSPFGEGGREVFHPRPGHADLGGYLKYDRSDIRDVLERSSARETSVRTAAGALARLVLREVGVSVVAFVTAIGKVRMNELSGINIHELEVKTEGSPVFCPDELATRLMIAEIEEAKRARDTLGGAVRVVVAGVVPGLGSYSQWDRRLDARLSYYLMSIQAVKAVEIGDGISASLLPGSAVHDEIYYSSERGYFRETNRAGGIEGGVSNGENIVVNIYMKPIPTLMKPLKSVDIRTKKQVDAVKERSDVCAVPSLSVIAKNVVSMCILDAYLEKFGSDTMSELRARITEYREYIFSK